MVVVCSDCDLGLWCFLKFACIVTQYSAWASQQNIMCDNRYIVTCENLEITPCHTVKDPQKCLNSSQRLKSCQFFLFSSSACCSDLSYIFIACSPHPTKQLLTFVNFQAFAVLVCSLSLGLLLLARLGQRLLRHLPSLLFSSPNQKQLCKISRSKFQESADRQHLRRASPIHHTNLPVRRYKF